MTVDENDVVYHYCSLDTFLSIIQNSKIWLSDVLKSNDKLEYLWIRNRVNDEIKVLLSENKKALKIWNKFEKLGSEITNQIIYTACFSEAEDSLSQWREYAQGAEGIAIGFSKTYLRALNSDNRPYLTFEKVVYEAEKQSGFIKSEAKAKIETMQFKPVGHVAMELDIDYSLEYSLHKNPSFVEEREWRIIFLSLPRRAVSDFALEGFHFSKTEFRSVNGKIVSYIELDFERIKRQLIKKIYIGPKSKVSRQDIQNVLELNGYYDDVEYNFDMPIPIVHSSSSYR